MMSRGSLLLAFLIVTVCSEAQQLTVYFASGSTQLDNASLDLLNEACKTYEGRTVHVVGHSDDQGSPELNVRISLDRAEAVDRLLRECNGITVRCATGAGGEEPIATNATVLGRSLNRRVELAFDPLPVAAVEPVVPRFAHSHSMVTPLMPDVDKPREYHRVDASSAIEQRMSDGTVVRIPAGALVDAQDRPVDGMVDLSYRAFLDPWDVVASGIPMHVKNGDETRHFETAGMYEVYASQNGAPVALRQGAEISLETQGPDVSEDYGAYQLDETSGEWRETVAFQTPRWIKTNATTTYNRLLRRLPIFADSLTFEERQLSPDYCYTTACIEARRPYRYDDGKYRSPYAEKQIPAANIVYDRRYWKDHRSIAFTVNTAYRRHPEWRSFPSDKRWLYTGDLDRRAFRKTISRKHFYQDVVLEANGTQGTIRLKDRGKWIDLPVSLFDPADEKSTKGLDGQLQNYDKRYTTKVRTFDRDVERVVGQRKRQRERIFNSAYARASRDMDSTERAMDRDQFDFYAMSVANNDLNYQQRDNAYMYSRRPTFAMPGFGIWNCDRMVPIPLIEVPVDVIVHENEQLQWLKAYGVPEKGRAVITYWNLDGKATQRMRLSPQCERIIFVDAHRNMVVATVPRAKRNAKGALHLVGTPMDQPRDRNALAALGVK